MTLKNCLPACLRVSASPRLRVFLAAAATLLTLHAPRSHAQLLTNAPPLPTSQGSFINSAFGYFTSFNTNLDSTFATDTALLWTGVDSIQGAGVNLANSVGVSYKVWKAVSLESETRTTGIAGVLLSQQLGANLGFTVHDARLLLYADVGYAIDKSAKDKIYGEIGVRVLKALTANTFAYIGVGAQLPSNVQVFSAGVGIKL
jgi:hypothetical protein